MSENAFPPSGAPMHPSDFELEPGLTFGDWLHSVLEADAHFESNAPMPNRALRVADRLQRGRPEQQRLVIEVPWLREFNAFTAPGRYIYISRRLLERCPDDHTLAFVIAHEMAHHDLGHMQPFAGPFAQAVARIKAGDLAVLFFHSLQKHLYSPEWEQDADRRALELCVASGFDGRKCLQFFHIAEMYALDVGDIDGVFGPEIETDPDGFFELSVLAPARDWLWQRRRGYQSIRERRARLEELVARSESTPRRSR